MDPIQNTEQPGSPGPARHRQGVAALALLRGLLLVIASSAAPAMSFSPFLGAPAAGPTPTAADAVLVNKAQRRLYLLHDGRPFRSYRVSLGIDPVGPKQRQGDNRTPEGHYVISARNAASRFHRALHISYPNAGDRLRASKAGVAPGGSIAIHGQPGGRNNRATAELLGEDDWTEGCIAVSNPAIEELWRLVPAGTPVEIRP